MDSYNQEDSYYDEATHLAALVGRWCRWDLNGTKMQLGPKRRKTAPKAQIEKRNRPSRPELYIKGLVCKEPIIAQFKEPVAKNRQLTLYEANCNDGYDSDFTVNT